MKNDATSHDDSAARDRARNAARNSPSSSAKNLRGEFPAPAQSAAQRTQARYAALRALMILENSDRPLAAALEDALRNDEISHRDAEQNRENRRPQNAAAAREYSRAANNRGAEIRNNNAHFPSMPTRADAPEIARGFVRELATGVCRHRARLDFTLAPLLKKPLEKLDAPVRAALRLAAYERIALDTPAHVVANEYAEAMRAARLKSAVGFVNAVARKLPQKWRDFPAKQRGTAQELACEYSHPLWLTKRWIARLGFENARDLCAANNEIAPLALRVNTRRAERDALLRELEARELMARGGAFSPSAILVERAGAPDAWPQWKRGEIIAQDEAAQLVSLFALHGIAPRDKNATPNESDGERGKTALNAPESAAQKSAFSQTDAPVFSHSTPPDDDAATHSATAKNLADTREKSAFTVAPTARDRAPFTVVDLCAAPGGKATHLAQLLGGGARVLALDSAPGRVSLIQVNAARLGLQIDAFRGDVLDASTREILQQKTGGADLVLVDAPCLGTGTLRRRPDAKWRKTPSQLAELVALQRELLDAAATTVRIGGVLVYSTCSLEPEENEEQARAFLARHSEYSLLAPRGVSAAWNALLTDEGFLRTSPARDGCDGAFAARFQRNA